MKRAITMFFAAALVAALPCAAQQAAGAPKSLRGSDAADSDQAPQERAYTGRKPGAQKTIARTFRSQPPLIPHAVENFDEVTLTENQCLECHGPRTFREKKAVKIGASHFVMRGGKPTAEISMARHTCVSCHVPQSDAPALVENTFRGEVKPAARRK